MDTEMVEAKINGFIVKASELQAEIRKLIKAAYYLKQEINDDSKNEKQTEKSPPP